MKKNLGEKLKELRVMKGISQEELAELAGVSLRTVQRFENSETKPRGDTVRRLFQIFGKSPEAMYDCQKEDNKNYLMLLALSGWVFLFSPTLGIIFSLLVWLNKADKINGVNELGKNLLNFLITMALPFYLFKAVSFLKLFPFLNSGDVSLGAWGSLSFISAFIYVNACCFGIVFIVTILNLRRIYNRELPWYKFAIPLIR